MKEFKELIHATLALVGYLGAILVWVFMLLLCVAMIISVPILVVAGVYKIICLICHMVFCWEIPILIGIGIAALFGLTGLDEAWD